MERVAHSIFSFLERHYWKFSLACAVLMALLAFSVTSFDRLPLKDGLGYLVKALEITDGNWTPLHDRFIGWSVVLAVPLKLLGVESIFTGAVVGRLWNIFLIALGLLVFAGVAKRIAPGWGSIIAVFAYLFSPILIKSGTILYSEPIFIVFTLAAVYFATHPSMQFRYLLLAVFFAGLAYNIRAPGLFLLVALLVFVGWQRLTASNPRFDVSWWKIPLLIALFFALSFPRLYLRYLTYGSPFDYGANSNYWVDSYSQLKSFPPAPKASFGEYLATHDLSALFDRFVVDGFASVSIQFYKSLPGIWAVLLISAVVVHFLFGTRSRKDLVFIVMAVMVFGMIPIWAIHDTQRYFVPVAPLVFLVGSMLVADLFRRHPQHATLTLCFVLGIISFFPLSILSNEMRFSGVKTWTLHPTVRDEWADWAADNVRGKVVIAENENILRLKILEKQGDGSARNFRALSPIEPFRPRMYASAEEALEEFRRMGVSYVFVDADGIRQRPYLKHFSKLDPSHGVVLKASFGDNPSGSCSGMDIFELRSPE